MVKTIRKKRRKKIKRESVRRTEDERKEDIMIIGLEAKYVTKIVDVRFMMSINFSFLNYRFIMMPA